MTTVPANEIGAELAVGRRHLPSTDLDDLLDGHAAPLAAILALDEDRFRALALQVAPLRRLTEGGRIMVGAYLHRHRSEFERATGHRSWVELVRAVEVKTATLGRWVLKTEQALRARPGRGAQPLSRGPRKEEKLASDASFSSVSDPDAPASSDVAKRPEPAGPPEAGRAPDAGQAPVPGPSRAKTWTGSALCGVGPG